MVDPNRALIMDSQSAIHDRRDLILELREKARLNHEGETTDIKTGVVIDHGQHGTDPTALPSEESLFQSLADSCGGGTNQYSILSGGIKWRRFPVTYAIDPAGSGLDSAATRSAVVKAFTEFDNQYPGQLFVLTNDFNNAKIKVQWKPIDDSLKTIGYTSYSYKLSSKELISATITFDRGDRWFVSGVERCTLDIQNVATHKIGHAVGLGHVGDRLQSMYSTSFTGETLKRSLGNGDKIGFDFLY